MINHFISLKYFSAKKIWQFVDLALQLKKNNSLYRDAYRGKNVGLIFAKPSLRTKTAFYVGVHQLGGEPIYYASEEVQLGEREKISDIAQTLSGYLDAVVLRTFSHQDILEFSKFSTIPVVNGLSDLSHPSQVISDLLTIYELKGDVKNLKVAYVGDGNNVCNSLIYAFAILGGTLNIATPKQHSPNSNVIKEANSFCYASRAKINIFAKAKDAVADADVIYTDVWTSMGQERERKKRIKEFKNYQINDKLLSFAKKDVIVMHCLPAHRGEEITDSVIDGDKSVVFVQAENRLYGAKAILLYALGGLI